MLKWIECLIQFLLVLYIIILGNPQKSLIAYGFKLPRVQNDNFADVINMPANTDGVEKCYDFSAGVVEWLASLTTNPRARVRILTWTPGTQPTHLFIFLLPVG